MWLPTSSATTSSARAACWHAASAADSGRIRSTPPPSPDTTRAPRATAGIADRSPATPGAAGGAGRQGRTRRGADPSPGHPAPARITARDSAGTAAARAAHRVDRSGHRRAPANPRGAARRHRPRLFRRNGARVRGTAEALLMTIAGRRDVMSSYLAQANGSLQAASTADRQSRDSHARASAGSMTRSHPGISVPQGLITVTGYRFACLQGCARARPVALRRIPSLSSQSSGGASRLADNPVADQALGPYRAVDHGVSPYGKALSGGEKRFCLSVGQCDGYHDTPAGLQWQLPIRRDHCGRYTR